MYACLRVLASPGIRAEGHCQASVRRMPLAFRSLDHVLDALASVGLDALRRFTGAIQAWAWVGHHDLLDAVERVPEVGPECGGGEDGEEDHAHDGDCAMG